MDEKRNNTKVEHLTVKVGLREGEKGGGKIKAPHPGNDQIFHWSNLHAEPLFVISLCVFFRPYETRDIKPNALDTLPSSGYPTYV